MRGTPSGCRSDSFWFKKARALTTLQAARRDRQGLAPCNTHPPARFLQAGRLPHYTKY